MEKIKSGIELCDSFFNNLIGREDIESSIANLIKSLYLKKQITKDKILQGLQLIREGNKNGG